VLDYDPESQQKRIQAEFHLAIRRVMVAMMMADGEMDDAELRTIAKIYCDITGTQLSETEIREEALAVQQESVSIQDYLINIGAALNSHGKELVVKAAFYVAAADGQFQDEEKQVIVDITNALQITSSHLNGIMAELMAPA